MDIPQLILRIILTFVSLLFLARIMGRKEISQMTFFNFVSAITIGSIAADLVLSPDITIENGIIALSGWTVMTLLMDLVEIKTIRGRHLVSGNPLIVIQDGKIIEKSLLTARLSIDYLMALLRQQGIFTVSEVDYAIFEIDGKLSVLKKDIFIPVTKFDMKFPAVEKKYGLPTTIISDGRVISENIKNLKLEQNWLSTELKKHEIKNISEVLFAQVQTDGSLFLEKKQILNNQFL